jgi:hypothetical protein
MKEDLGIFNISKDYVNLVFTLHVEQFLLLLIYYEEDQIKDNEMGMA